MGMVPPSRMKTRQKLRTKHYRRCYWLLHQARTDNGLETNQAELTLFLDELTVQDFYVLLNLLQTDKKETIDGCVLRIGEGRSTS